MNGIRVAFVRQRSFITSLFKRSNSSNVKGDLGTDRFGLSKLPNGIRIASLDTPGSCIAGGLHVDVSSNGRLPFVAGHAANLYILEKLAFKATQNLTEQKMHSKLDELIGTVQAKARRESILYSGAVVPAQLKTLLSLLHEVVSHPLVTDGDLNEMKSVIEYELEELKNKPDELMLELCHGPAFYSNQTGDDGFMDWNSLVGMSRDLESCSIAKIMQFWRETFTTDKMTVVGCGMSHGELYNAASENFGSLTKSAIITSSQDKRKELLYLGGSNYIENGELPLVHVAIGFKGYPAASEQAFPLAILHMLMGGGSSFSAGGPGKGMYSRLYTQVLNRYHWIESCRVFDNFYRNTGIFGIHGSALPSNTRDLVEVLMSQLYGMTESLTRIELERAKNQVKSSLLMGLESRLTELEDMAEQVNYCDKYRSPRELCKRIDEVTEEELQAVAADLLNSKPTVVAYGPLYRMPSYETITKWHQSKLSSSSSSSSRS